MKAWLYRDFKFWFTGWFVLLICSLFVYAYNNEFGVILLRFVGTMIIALLTAMAAFDHMDTNEKKKLAREQYLNYSALIVSLDERYQNIMCFRETYKGLFNQNRFVRGIEPPFFLVRGVSEPPNMSKFDFLKSHYNDSIESNINSYQSSVFNAPYLSKLFSDFDYLVQLIDRRNEIHDTKICKALDLNYSGDGQTHLRRDELYKLSIPYVELTRFLMLSEQIMKLTDDLYHCYRSAIDELGEHAKTVLDSEIAKENSGYPAIHYNFENDHTFYVELSQEQMSEMSERDYYSRKDYTQRFF